MRTRAADRLSFGMRDAAPEEGAGKMAREDGKPDTRVMRNGTASGVFAPPTADGTLRSSGEALHAQGLCHCVR